LPGDRPRLEVFGFFGELVLVLGESGRCPSPAFCEQIRSSRLSGESLYMPSAC
jgi:hypothetical protein